MIHFLYRLNAYIPINQSNGASVPVKGYHKSAFLKPVLSLVNVTLINENIFVVGEHEKIDFWSFPTERVGIYVKAA